MFNQNQLQDVMIIGGGLAGLTTAVYLARAGRQVTVLEKARHLGGRAATRERDGFLFNQGPHALYAAGEGVPILRDLNVDFSGGKPAISGTTFLVKNGALWPLPADPVTMATSRLLNWRQKLVLSRVFLKVMRTKPADVVNVPLQTWVEAQTSSMMVQQFLYAFARLTTYANAPEQLSTAVFIQQLQRSIRQNVYYLDGGWQTLVDGLQQAAEQAGAVVETGVRITAVHEREDGIRLMTSAGQTLEAGSVVVATDPHTAARLLPAHEPVTTAAETAVPVRAAVLDVGLRRLPHPDRTFALGLDSPTYLSLHSGVARLAPDGGALLHLAYYLPPEQNADRQIEQELEQLLDLVQPGWQEERVTQRFLPEMTVVNTLATAVTGGLTNRPNVALTNRLYLAGDWVGPTGWLADASFSSGREAARRILAQPPHPVETAAGERLAAGS